MAMGGTRFLEPKFPGQRCLLAFDGGGIRGLISLGILEAIESDLAVGTRRGPDFRLSDYFDFIGGTSTGAIIAAGLSTGLTVKALIAFYRDAGALMFKKEILLKRAWNIYEADPLRLKLQEVLGESTTLGSADIRTLLLIVTRNLTTDSPWPLTNNPFAKYNVRSRADCNLDLPLWQLVRASTAAPVYFPPEVVTLGPNSFVFVDGGVTPYNIPAFLMFRMATAAPYKLQWPIGETKMMILSVGTGSAPRLGPTGLNPDRTFVGVAQSIAGEMMNGMAYDQDVNCRTIGRCSFGSEIDREIGTLVPDVPLVTDLGRQFLYARYDPLLTREGLDDIGLKDVQTERVATLDSVDAVDELLAVGRAYATKYVDPLKHFVPFHPAVRS